MELSKQEMELFFLLLGLESKNFPRAHGMEMGDVTMGKSWEVRISKPKKRVDDLRGKSQDLRSSLPKEF